MSDNITLPRKHIDYAAHALEHFNKDAPDPLVSEIIHHLRAALAAEQPVPTDKDSLTVQSRLDAESFREERDEARALLNGVLQDIEALRRDAEQPKHPGYIIGSHWLETAYSRICAGEAEADVLRDCGWERVDDIKALRRDAERFWMVVAAMNEKPKPVAWMFVNLDGECEQIEYGTPPTDDDSITPLYIAPPEDDALRRDAERYRWLREKDGITVDVTVFGSMEANLDAAIDAAMENKR